MAKRLNKRQQREVEELRELEAAKVELQSSAQAETSESEDEQVTALVKKKFNPFDAVSYRACAVMHYKKTISNLHSIDTA